MEEYTISIIVPVYNVEKYLNRCLESLVKQTYKKIEILLIDDGSTDGSGALCDKWQRLDSRIRVIHKKNGGLASARNTGIQNASGDYFGFVDSDDWISLNMYETLLHLIVEFSADIACCGIQYVSTEDIKSKEIKETLKVYSQEEYAKKFFKISSNETVHYAVNKLYKRQVGKSIHYPEGLIDEDVEGFIHALINSKKIVTTNIVMYYYWQNINGISYKWFSNKQLDLLKVWDNVIRICREKKPEWVPYAELNKKRAYFGLLSRLALNSEEEDSSYHLIERKLIYQLKIYERDLLKSSIPNNRKVLLFLMCRNYDLTKKLIRMFKEGYHHKA